MSVQEILQTLEVAVGGQDDAGVHHDRLDDHPGDLARVLLEGAGDGLEVVERNDRRRVP